MNLDPADSIRDGLRPFLVAGAALEVRILKTPKKTVSGYFTDLDVAVQALERATRQFNGASAFYVTLNPVNRECVARAANQLKPYADCTSTDADVVRRQYLLIDCDPARPAGISSTEDELTRALTRRNDVVAYLTTQGWPSPIRAMSGNGGHALYRIDLPNSNEARDLVRGCLTALARMFSTEHVTIDTSVYNAARIVKAYGTMARKGDDTPERPHRRSAIEEHPGELVIVTEAQLEQLASQVPKKATLASSNVTHAQYLPRSAGRDPLLDYEQEFRARGTYLRPLSSGKHAVRCPWIETHTSESGITETVIFEPPSPGDVWGFKCQHAHCETRTIEDVWKLFRAPSGPGRNGAGTDRVSQPANEPKTPPKPADGGAQAASRDFRETDEDCYALTLLQLGIQFQANYLRRERYETFGELVVVCDLAGARVVEGNVLSRGTFNFSSPVARHQRARQLADMSKAPELDWPRLLEELCAKVLAKHGDGEPAVLLSELARPTRDEQFTVAGLLLLKKHPVVLFGDGGAAKSYLALFLAGLLAQRGLRVGLFDWELAGEDHRDRLERLFGDDMPAIWYRSCRHPLIVELDSLRRLARRERLDFLVYDSVAFAAHDKPEAAESAISYFRAVRQIGPGSLHVAHITKTEGGDQKPFGSAFWHNAARGTYFMQRAAESSDGRQITIGMFNRKANLGRLQPAFGFQFDFSNDQTIITPTNVADVQDFAERLPLWQRIAPLVKTHPLTVVEIATALDAKIDTVAKAVGRSSMFTKVLNADGITRFGLVDRRAS